MRFVHPARILALVALASAAAPAAAFECYAIVDRSNEVIYQDPTPPIDLSADGAAARDALRARGQQLIVMDTPRCPAIDRLQAGGKGGPATVEDIVAGMRPAVPFGSARSRTTRDSGGIALPEIRPPRATGGGMSVGGPVSGMSVR
ncbi:MAG TPA: hypothetical protein VN858_05205 [Casimicrobiaceae bacterium]|nr:hypothetical protein [Casimicrobiaceae bacterium]